MRQPGILQVSIDFFRVRSSIRKMRIMRFTLSLLVIELVLIGVLGCKKETQTSERKREFRELVLVREEYPMLDTFYISKDYKPRPTDVIVLDVTDWDPGKDALVFIRNELDVFPIIPYLWQGEDTIFYTFSGKRELWINRTLVGVHGSRFEQYKLEYPDCITTLGDNPLINLDAIRYYKNAATLGVFFTTHMGKYPTIISFAKLMLIPKARDIKFYISNNGISNLDFLAFALLPNLEFIEVTYYEKDAWGLGFLSIARNLREVSFWSRWLTESDLLRISRIRNLRRLTIDSDTIEEEGFKHLKNLKNLTELHVNSPSVGDKALNYISRVENLHVLQLLNSAVTDTGLECLENLCNLRSLDLSNCSNITDSGLVHLEKVTSLRRLKLFSEDEEPYSRSLLILHNYPYFPNPRVTREGVERLQKALPECEIIWKEQE